MLLLLFSCRSKAQEDSLAGYVASIYKQKIDTAEILIDTDGKAVKLADAVGKKVKLIYVFNDRSCGANFDHALFRLRSNKDKIAPKDVLMLFTGDKMRDMRIYEQLFLPYRILKAKYKPIISGNMELGLPYFYTLSANSKVAQNVFIPKKEDDQRTNEYLDNIMLKD
ncbi:MAG: hypothetical protein KA313_06670 [Pseudarcicella sp.]|nr:hypothetical protein [Pseudarcicella sp.]